MRPVTVRGGWTADILSFAPAPFLLLHSCTLDTKGGVSGPPRPRPLPPLSRRQHPRFYRNPNPDPDPDPCLPFRPLAAAIASATHTRLLWLVLLLLPPPSGPHPSDRGGTYQGILRSLSGESAGRREKNCAQFTPCPDGLGPRLGGGGS